MKQDQTMVLPTLEEITRSVLGTIRHVVHIEYYLDQLQIGTQDPQRPHDITGEGNKLEWEVLKGLALAYRYPIGGGFDEHVRPALERHRACQYHHQQWNNSREHVIEDAMRLGAADAICSLREPDRTYQGGRHTFRQIEKITRENSPCHAPWMIEILREMRKVPSPPIMSIKRGTRIPRCGLLPITYDFIIDRLEETRTMLAEQGYNVRNLLL